MDKIKSLLEKAGCKKELVDQIVESLHNYKNSVREEYEKEYAAKVEQAKKVCIEETEAHKRELAKRLQIFCETKSAAIEAQLAKKSALNETEAESRLKEIRNLLEGIQPSGSQNGDVTAALEQAKRQVKVAKEERDRAVEVANRRAAIAKKALKQSRELTNKYTRLEQKLEKKGSINEGKKRQPNNKRIDKNRRKSRAPVSTRSTLFESQSPRPSSKNNQPNTKTVGPKSFSPDSIAQEMDEDLL